MNKIIKIVVTVVLSSVVSLCFANGGTVAPSHGIYGDLHGGLTVPSHDRNTLKTGWDAGGALGVYHGPFRAELAATYYRNSQKSFSGHLNLWTLMVNGYYGFLNDSRITPYIGAGIGWVNAKNSAGALSAADNELGYQGIIGLAASMTPRVDLAMEYHLLSFTSSRNTLYNVFDVKLSYRFSGV